MEAGSGSRPQEGAGRKKSERQAQAGLGAQVGRGSQAKRGK